MNVPDAIVSDNNLTTVMLPLTVASGDDVAAIDAACLNERQLADALEREPEFRRRVHVRGRR